MRGDITQQGPSTSLIVRGLLPLASTVIIFPGGTSTPVFAPCPALQPRDRTHHALAVPARGPGGAHRDPSAGCVSATCPERGCIGAAPGFAGATPPGLWEGLLPRIARRRT